MSQPSVSTISTLTDLGDEPILDPPGPNATMEEYRAYIQQQHARLEALQNAATPPTIQAPAPKEKPFYIKVMGDKPGLFAGDSYKEWTQYVWEMENQFDMNQVDDYAKNPDKAKLSFAVTFLKRGSNAQLLWSAKARNNPGQNYTWKEFVDFLKENTKGASTRKEDNFEKYRNYKQQANQSVRDYDAHRIALFSDLHPSMKPSPAIELQDFVLNLTQDNQSFLAEQGIEDDKDMILKRLKQREDYERKKQRNVAKNKPGDGSNKRKKDDENSDADGDNNRSNRNRRRDRKGGKKPKSDNPNREPVKSKKLWRWTKAEYKDIVDNNKCIGCGKSGCNIKDCKDIKSDTRSFEEAFHDPKSKK